jgi:hypothetical protein
MASSLDFAELEWLEHEHTTTEFRDHSTISDGKKCGCLADDSACRQYPDPEGSCCLHLCHEIDPEGLG